MFAKRQAEHQWLEQLIGDGKFEHDCQMPDGTTSKTPDSMFCRSLGGLWVICESNGESAEGESWLSIMTLGFDPKQSQYVGTFVGSMMANIWPYQGVVDASGKRQAASTRFRGPEVRRQRPLQVPRHHRDHRQGQLAVYQ